MPDWNPRLPVAAGRISLYYHRFIYPWDIAPGLLLVQEAGGIVTDWQGHPAALHSSQIIASNAKLRTEFMGHIRNDTPASLH